MLQQLSNMIDNISPKPTASAGLDDRSVVSSASGDDYN